MGRASPAPEDFGASASETANPGSPRDGQPRHRQPVFKAGSRTLGLERLRAHRRKQHRIQLERIAGRARHGQMAQMRRVKTAAEEGHAAAAFAGAAVCPVLAPGMNPRENSGMASS